MQHSPSSISLAQRCERAWWLRYREGLKPPEIPWLRVKRMKARGQRLPAGAYSRALGTEMHRLAEIYLTVPPRRVSMRSMIDWNDLPGQCLAELVPHLPAAGSLKRSQVERRMSVSVEASDGERVAFRGLIDMALAAREIGDHKTTRDIRAYALLPDAVAQRLGQPKRSLANDLQAAMYSLSRGGAGALCRWNYTETDRTRRALPVVQYIPRAQALRIAKPAADVARTVEGFETIEDAVPDTTACDQYGGCWYRSEGHCRVPRKWGAVFMSIAQEETEKANMSKLGFKALGEATAKANKDEEKKAKAAAAAEAPRKRKPAPEPEDTDEDDDEEPESEPAPRAKKKAKSKPAPAVEDADDADEDDTDDSEERAANPPKAKAKTERERLAEATVAPDHILQFFGGAGLKGEAKILATAFAELAEHLATNLPRNPERAQCLRKLLEANDCAVRAAQGEA